MPKPVWREDMEFSAMTGDESGTRKGDRPSAIALFRPGQPVVQARLLAGATEDLNVMVARDTCRSSSDVLAVPRGTFDRDLGTGQHVVLALDGALEVAGVALAPGDAVRLGGSGRCAVTTAGAATFLLASFW